MNLKEKYERTKDIWLHNPNRDIAHSYGESGRGRVLEIQLGPSCKNKCGGCRDERDMLDGSPSFLSDNPDSIDRLFDLIVDSSDKWRIQLSGAVTDPVSASQESLDRVFGRSEGHDIILHHGAYDLRDFQSKILSRNLFAREGNFVIVRSHNAPILYGGITTQDGVSALEFTGIDRMQRQIQSKIAAVDYLMYQLSLGMFRNQRINSGFPVDKAPIVIKQLIYQNNPCAPFDIESESSIDVQREAIRLWGGLFGTDWSASADTYMIAPAFYRKGVDRLALQMKFDAWIHNVMESFKGNLPHIGIMIRRYCLEPQNLKKPEVAGYQYTVNRAGFFAPCDYSEMQIPGLPRIDDRSLTKEMVDEAYRSLTYKTEPCKSCRHKNCANDWYG